MAIMPILAESYMTFAPIRLEDLIGPHMCSQILCNSGTGFWFSRPPAVAWRSTCPLRP